MRLQRFNNPQLFAEASENFLIQNEVENNLLFGIVETLVTQPERYTTTPYLALVYGENEPVIATLRTPPHSLVLSKAKDTKALELVARDLRETNLPGVSAAANEAEAFANVWQSLTGQSYSLTMPQRIYKLERVIPVQNVPGKLHLAGSKERPLLIKWVQAFHAEALSSGPPQNPELVIDTYLNGKSRDFYLWEVGGKPVSLAGFSGPTPTGIRVNAVFTPRSERRRGYASACVASLSQLLLDRGFAFCCLFTDLRNPTSNHIYQAIGYEAVCDVHAYRFD